MAKEDVKKSDVPENDKEPAKDGNIADTDLVSSDNKVNGSNSLSNSSVNIDESPITSEGTVNSDESSGFNENTDNDVEKLSDSNSEGDADDGIGESNGIDIDLTALSSTMIYSEVSNMMFEPDDYVGKTVKMEGNFSVYHDEASDKYYFACIIQDATACCAQGLEFVLKDSYKFPDDYPEVGEEVCVSGVFDTYYESGYYYCTLRNAVFDEPTYDA